MSSLRHDTLKLIPSKQVLEDGAVLVHPDAAIAVDVERCVDFLDGHLLARLAANCVAFGQFVGFFCDAALVLAGEWYSHSTIKSKKAPWVP